MSLEDYTFEELVAKGALVFVGIDEDDGEPLYVMVEEVAKEVCPEIYWAEKNAIDVAIADAVEQGYLDWDVNPNTLEETLTVTMVGEEAIRE